MNFRLVDNANETVMKNDIIREKMMLLKRSVKKKSEKEGILNDDLNKVYYENDIKLKIY